MEIKKDFNMEHTFTTKKEAREFLTNTKVYVNGCGEEVQKTLFDLGIYWNTGREELRTQIRATWPFLYIKKEISKLTGEEELVIKSGGDMQCFVMDDATAVSVDDILAIEVKDFEPFQKVLVRDTDRGNWTAAFYSHGYFDDNMDCISYVTCGGIRYLQCIAYEGNESLLGASKNTNE